MAIVYDRLMALKIPDSEQNYTARDAIFYALSLGLGHHPLDEDELRFVYEKDLKVVVLGTGGMSHQLQGKRFGFMNEKFDQWFLDQLEADPEGLAGVSHQHIMEQAGAEAVELIMWLTMRGAVSKQARRVHRHYYAPMTTGMGLITFEDE